MATSKTKATANVSYEALNSANVRISNKGDENRALDIAANVNIQNSSVSGIDSGTVTKDGNQAAAFSRYGNNNLSVNFYCAEEQQVEVLAAINEFIASVTELVANQPMNTDVNQ